MARLSPSLAQSIATLRNDGTIALGATPTVGNLMLLATSGYQVSLSAYAPAGFVRLGNYTSDTNNGVMLWHRRVKSGDTGSYSITASDNQSAVLYEFANACSAYPLAGGAMSSFFSGNNFTLPIPSSPFGESDQILGIVENDTTAVWSFTAETGLTDDYCTPSSASNHTGGFFRTSTSHDGIMAGSLSGTPSNPVFGLFAIAGAFA